MEETARVLDDWSPCKVCGGSQMTTMHLYAPEPKPRPETIRRRLAAWAEHTSKPGWERRMLKEAP